MKIAHMCLSCFYIDGRAYQENELVRRHVADGHDVLVLASTEQVDPSGRAVYGRPDDYIGTDGARVIRLDYRFGPATLARKLRIHPGVYQRLAAFKPDAILFHGACGWEIMTAARYASDHPEVLFYVDSHEDWNNSARTFASRELLHKLYYKFCLRRALPAIRKILCISTETMDFVEGVYGVERDHLEFFPLGGEPVEPAAYRDRRKRTREELSVKSDEIMLVQSGKQTRRKKLMEALRAFRTSAPANARLFIAGALDATISREANDLIETDPRVRFLGWKPADQLTDLLCAADVYLQPGTQSVTMQHSLCCHCAVIIDDTPAHHVYIEGNGWLVNDSMRLERALSEIASANLEEMQERSFSLAQAMLDYAKLNRRILIAEPEALLVPTENGHRSIMNSRMKTATANLQ